jgi:hypothetical protein
LIPETKKTRNAVVLIFYLSEDEMKSKVSWGLLVTAFSLFSFSSPDALANEEEIFPVSAQSDLDPAWVEAEGAGSKEEIGVEPLRLSSDPWGSPTPDSQLVSQAGATVSPPPVSDGPPAPKLGISVTGLWASKYMFKGFHVLDSGVYMHDVTLDLWQTGFQMKYQGAYPSHDRGKSLIAGNVPPPLEDVIDRLGISFDREDIDAFTYNLSWKGKICEGFDVEVGGNYYDMFGLDSDKADFWEGYGIFTLSKLPLAPHFGAYYALPYNDDKKGEGWLIDIGVTHMQPIPGCEMLCLPPTALILSADLWYNGGAWSGRVDPGWAYAEFKAMMPIPLRENLTLIPGVTYQLSIEDTVAEDDEIYANVALQYKW